jgi:hypothetical protein
MNGLNKIIENITALLMFLLALLFMTPFGWITLLMLFVYLGK